MRPLVHGIAVRSNRYPHKPYFVMIVVMDLPAPIASALDRLPSELLGRSGRVFYTGNEAFAGPRSLYLLGLNPGGDPVDQREETIEADLAQQRARNEPWSAYADDRWHGAQPGKWGLQQRVLHMLDRLCLDPRDVPASNVVFVRTRAETDLRAEKAALLEACWPVHEAVIETLRIKVVVCFGSTAGRWVRDRTGASRQIDQFVEGNSRGWKSFTHEAPSGLAVVTVSHPGRADWRNGLADPTPLVEAALARQ